jgi:hypothetical protein
VTARTWIAAGCAAALLAGCGGADGGGGDGEKKPVATKTAAPKAKEPLAAAARRLERALPSGDCKRLAPLMLHSVRRGKNVDPAKPPAREECRFISTEITRDLKGFKVTKVQEFGPAGFAEGTTKRVRRGEAVGTLWALDTDRSWKLLYDATLRTQTGFPPNPGFDANARTFVGAVARRDCDGMWLLFNVGSRFVRSVNGKKARFCKQVAPAYKDKGNGFADVAADGNAKPQKLGAVRDVAFFAVRLRSGRYMVAAMAGRFGGIADAEQKYHGDPSVIEFLTVRRPSGGS